MAFTLSFSRPPLVTLTISQIQAGRCCFPDLALGSFVLTTWIWFRSLSMASKSGVHRIQSFIVSHSSLIPLLHYSQELPQLIFRGFSMLNFFNTIIWHIYWFKEAKHQIQWFLIQDFDAALMVKAGQYHLVWENVWSCKTADQITKLDWFWLWPNSTR